MKIVGIFGSSGFLATNLIHYLGDENKYLMIGSSNSDIKLNNYDSISMEKIINKFKFDVIINCVGYTKIDIAKENQHECLDSNAYFVNRLVYAIQKSKLKPFLIHISTDHFYNTKGYTKEKNIVFKNFYAHSKYLGELFAKNTKCTILRTNFFGNSLHKKKYSLSDWIIKSLKNNKKIYCFEDIYFNPIHFSTLAKVIKKVIIKQKKGVFNVGSKNGLNKLQFAIKIAKILKLNEKLILKSNSDKFFKVPRPLDMRMKCNVFEKEFKFKMPTLKNEIELLTK
tara:strand:- start:25 stop:870 length:846 start_codon:yes stop_codon:yes gene_type:complete